MGKQLAIKGLDFAVEGVAIKGPSLKIGALTREQFEDLGWKLKGVNGYTQFWIGDWANALYEQHGKGAMLELAAAMGYEHGTILDLAGIARRYESTDRSVLLEKYPQLTATHFDRAASAPNPIAVLEAAGKKGWSTREVQDYVTENYPKQRVVEATAGEVHFSWVKHPAVKSMVEVHIPEIRNTIGMLTAVDREDPKVAVRILVQLEQVFEELLDQVREGQDE